jgi:hypothetical protein
MLLQVFYINLFWSAQLWRCSSCLFFYHIISNYILVLDVNGVDICRQKPEGPLGCFSPILTDHNVCVYVHTCVCMHFHAWNFCKHEPHGYKKRQSRPGNLFKTCIGTTNPTLVLKQYVLPHSGLWKMGQFATPLRTPPSTALFWPVHSDHFLHCDPWLQFEIIASSIAKVVEHNF